MSIITLSITLFILSFLISFVLLRMSYNEPYFKDGFILLCTIMLGTTLAALYFSPINYDSLSSFSFIEIISVFGSSLIIYLISRLQSKLTILPIIIGAAICTLIVPQDFLLFDGLLPLVPDRLATIAIWAVISYCYQYLNASNAIMCLHTIMIGLGIIVLYFIGAIPFTLALITIAIIGTLLSLLFFNGFPTYIIITNGLCQAVGFICAWLLFKLSQEGLPGNALTLLAYFAIETLSALATTLLPGNTTTIALNTNYSRAINSGLLARTALFSVGKIMLLLVIFSCFQLYSDNLFSIPLLSLVICSFFVYRLRNWQEKPQTLREINSEFIEDVKDSIKDIKDTFNKDKP